MRQQSIYLCIDLKSFYASVECIERGLDPMTTDLVVADPARTDKTICLAVSPSMKAKGVRNRCRVFEIPHDMDYIMAPPRMQKYIDYSAEIYAVYLKYVAKDDIFIYSIDEVFVDLTHYLLLYDEDARKVAGKIMTDILETTGIPAACGIGTNLYLAKVAMDITAKHVDETSVGYRIGQLDERTYRETLWNHEPLTDIWRVGPATASRLAKYGIFTMGDIALASLQQEDLLYRLFGVDAELLIDHAWGEESCTMEDIKAYRPQNNCLSSGQVLPSAYNWDKARLIVKEMADALILELVEKGMAAVSFTLHVGYDRSSAGRLSEECRLETDRYGRAVPKHAHGTVKFSFPTNSRQTIMAEVEHLYGRITDPRLSVRRINLTANDLQEERYIQCSLFADQKELKEEKAMQRALIDIKKKFGKNAVLKGMDLEEGATARERNRQIGGHKA